MQQHVANVAFGFTPAALIRWQTVAGGDSRLSHCMQQQGACEFDLQFIL